MADPAVNTKIERVAEAIESLTVAVAANDGGQAFDSVRDARAELSTALHQFLQPALRVVNLAAERAARGHGIEPR